MKEWAPDFKRIIIVSETKDTVRYGDSEPGHCGDRRGERCI